MADDELDLFSRLTPEPGDRARRRPAAQAVERMPRRRADAADQPSPATGRDARGETDPRSTPSGGDHPGAAGASAPLAERLRPAHLDQVVGQAHLLGPGHIVRGMIEGGRLHSLLLWGPPGSGKTTIARLLAQAFGLPWVQLSAVLSGVKDLRAAVERADLELRATGRPTVVFIDEIHRFNKAQQDALLPHVEKGTIVLIGATTENPSFEVIAPLLSRLRVLTLEPLGPEDVGALLDRAVADREQGLGDLDLTLDAEARHLLVDHAGGDARIALGTLEVAAEQAARRPDRTITGELVTEAAQRRSLRYDRAGDEHYNVVSAFIKSMRGSDPDAALYWLVRMLEAGEDPLFIARRMVIFAAEDVGNADPRALQVAIAVKDAVHFVGLPEGRIPLAQGATYLATAPKSNASYAALNAATDDVRRTGTLGVPLHLRNAPTALMRELGYAHGYQYPHDDPEHFVAEEYLPDELRGRRYYEPMSQGEESAIRDRLDRWRARRDAERPPTRRRS